MGTAKPKKPSAKQKRRLMRADADARKVNGIRLKPIKHKKLYGAAARSVVESRLSPSLTLSSQFYEDKNDSKTDSKAKVKPIIQVHGVPVLLSEFEKLASGSAELHRPHSAAAAAMAAATVLSVDSLSGGTDGPSRFTQRSAAQAGLPVLHRIRRTGSGHPFLIGPRGSQVHSTEAALAALHAEGGRIFKVVGPRAVQLGTLLSARGFVMLAKDNSPRDAPQSVFDEKAAGQEETLLGVQYGIPHKGGATRITPTFLGEMVAAYKLLRSDVEGPWHANKDDNWRPRGTVDFHHATHASAEWGLTSRFQGGGESSIRYVNRDARGKRPEIDGFFWKFLRVLLDDVAPIVREMFPEAYVRNAGRLAKHVALNAEMFEGMPWSKVSAALNNCTPVHIGDRLASNRWPTARLRSLTPTLTRV